jgi:hypothetical protein
MLLDTQCYRCAFTCTKTVHLAGSARMYRGSYLVMERGARIELALSAWEAEVLPLNELRMTGTGRECMPSLPSTILWWSPEFGAGEGNRTLMRLASASLEG